MCQYVQYTASKQVVFVCMCVCERFCVLSGGEAVSSNGKQQSLYHVH